MLRRCFLKCRLEHRPLTTENLIGILTNSNANPVGRITDDFDKQMKAIVADATNTHLITKAILNPAVREGKFKVPVKMREVILSAIHNHIEALTLNEFLAIPVVMRRLPPTLVSSDAEDLLYEQFLTQLVNARFSQMSPEQGREVVINIAKLNMKHQCKSDPTVRFFQAIANGPGLPVQQCIHLLEALPAVLSRQKLTHPTIRAVCFNLVQGLGDPPVGTVLKLASRLPVFPAISDFADSICRKAGTLSSGQVVDAVVGLASIDCSDELATEVLPQWTMKLVKNESDVKSALTRIGALRRVNQRALTVLAGSLESHTVSSLDNGSIAGWLRVFSTSSKFASQIEAVPLKFIPSSTDLGHAVSAASIIADTADEATTSAFISRCILPYAAQLTSGQLRTLLSSRPEWIRARIVEVIDQVSDVDAVATALVHTDSQIVAERLRVLLKPVTDVDTLIRIANILNEAGIIYATPELLQTPRGKILKEVTGSVFRAVRMAPIPKIVKS